jgi:hypothetical protein
MILVIKSNQEEDPTEGQEDIHSSALGHSGNYSNLPLLTIRPFSFLSFPGPFSSLSSPLLLQ